MAWVLKVEKQAPGGGGRVTEFIGSGIADEKAAHDHVRLQSVDQVEIYTIAKISDAELEEYGVPVGRTQVIQYAGEVGDRRVAEKRMNAEAFLQEWVADNADPSSDDNVSTPRSLASKCFAEATNRRIDVDDVSKAAGGDLEQYIAEAMKPQVARGPN